MTKIFYALDPVGQTSIASNMDKTQSRLVNRVGLSRKHVLAAVAESVARLGTYIDVLQIHRLDKEVPAEEIMRALNDVVESGQVRYLGASSMATWEFQKLQYVAEKNGWHKFISMQGYYNLLYREEEREMIPYCQDSKVGLLPWAPLARGVLTRPWSNRTSKREMTDKLLQNMVRGKESPADQIIVSRVEEIALKRGVDLAVVALAWCFEKGVCPIAGLGSTERIDQSVDAIQFKLAKEEVEYLEEPYLPREVMY
jgi:aryl-alcohol dehydrogenase-like predicted oxidoreductase